MNPGIKKALEALAKSLPPMVDNTMNLIKRVKGQQLIDAWHDPAKEPHDGEGKPIDPKAVYILKDPMPVDHLKNLHKAWGSKGQVGVDRYKEIINKRYAESLAEQTTQAQESSNKQ